MNRSCPMLSLFRSNEGDVKRMPLMHCRTNIIHLLEHTIYYRQLKINSMSVRGDTVKYFMTQKDHKRRYR